MKHFTSTMIRPMIMNLAIMFIGACNGPSLGEAREAAQEIKASVTNFTPGTIETSKTTYWMSAKVDGKPWTASHMLPDEATNSSYKRILGEDKDLTISFSLYLRGLTAGKKISFSDDDVVDFIPKADYTGFWGGRTGHIELTAVNEQYMEGKFIFTATSSSSSKVYEVSDGFFRVPVK